MRLHPHHHRRRRRPSTPRVGLLRRRPLHPLSHDGPDSLYERFTTDLAARWNIEDEGPVSDLLNVDISMDADSVILKQEKYINQHLVETYLPDGVPLSFHKTQAPDAENWPAL
eukprot:6201812-Pleurochrysis_carterae.AAC.3